MLESGEECVEALRQLMDSHPAWQEYKGQSHDLFISNKEKEDVFLLEDSSEKRYVGLLSYDAGSAPQSGSPFTSAGSIFASDDQSRRSSQAAFPASSPSKDYARAAVTPVGSATPPPVRTSSNPFDDRQSAPIPQPSKIIKLVNSSQSTTVAGNVQAPTARKESLPPQPQIVAKDTTAEETPTTTRPSTVKFATVVVRGEHGLGLDLEKTAEGGAAVKRIKDMPGVVNPAQICYPPIKEGDTIIGVNGKKCHVFADVVKEIRASGGSIEIGIERKA
jgi:hypothetical protein